MCFSNQKNRNEVFLIYEHHGYDTLLKKAQSKANLLKKKTEDNMIYFWWKLDYKKHDITFRCND